MAQTNNHLLSFILYTYRLPSSTPLAQSHGTQATPTTCLDGGSVALTSVGSSLTLGFSLFWLNNRGERAGGGGQFDSAILRNPAEVIRTNVPHHLRRRRGHGADHWFVAAAVNTRNRRSLTPTTQSHAPIHNGGVERLPITISKLCGTRNLFCWEHLISGEQRTAYTT
jgi:hypothetical protein